MLPRRPFLFLVLAAAASGQRNAPDPDEPQRLFRALALEPGAAVAEIGAGDGEIAAKIAAMLGPSGRLFATEMEEAKRQRIVERAKSAGLGNVEVIEAKEKETNLPESCCQAIYLRTVYHHFTDPQPMAASLFRSLKSGGRIAVIDFEPRSGPSGNPSGLASRGGHGIPRPVLIEEMKAAGFEFVEETPKWSARNFCVVFRKP